MKSRINKERKNDAGLHCGFFIRGSHTGLICRPRSRLEVERENHALSSVCTLAANIQLQEGTVASLQSTV